MTEFEHDVAQRKKLARMAQYRKCGSKSKRCSLSTDGMTRKQWEKRNGEVMSVKLNKPMSWEEFKALSRTLQMEYLQNLVKEYGVSARSLAAMFGKTPQTVIDYLKKNELGFKFKRGNVMKPEQRSAWETFLSGQREVVAPANAFALEPELFSEQAYYPCNDEALDVKIGVLTPTTTYQPKMNMRSFSLCFDGRIDVGAISNSLMSILGDDAEGKVDIVCNLAGGVA